MACALTTLWSKGDSKADTRAVQQAQCKCMWCASAALRCSNHAFAFALLTRAVSRSISAARVWSWSWMRSASSSLTSAALVSRSAASCSSVRNGANLSDAGGHGEAAAAARPKSVTASEVSNANPGPQATFHLPSEQQRKTSHTTSRLASERAASSARPFSSAVACACSRSHWTSASCTCRRAWWWAAS